ncbi:MAG TPA: EAL domain-containing protein [Symbiobacteriaceae bacterium]|nr:EAL domain-containing protein [Symbiobacteriaceae bacterium]
MSTDSTAMRPEPMALRRYELLSELTRDIVLFIRPDGHIAEANRAALNAYGYTRSELLSMRIHDLRAEEQRPQVDAQIVEAREHGLTFETVHRRKNGTLFPVEVNSSAAPIGGMLLNVVRDITLRKQRETTRALLQEIDHKILERQPLPDILQTVCDKLSQLLGYALVWIAMKQEGGSVGILAAAGGAQAFLHEVTIRWDDSLEGAGPTGMAIKTGHIQKVTLDVESVRHWREQAESHGLVAALSLPLTAGTETIGALSIYAERDVALDTATVQDLSRFANQVAISILAARDQGELRLRTAALEAAANAVVITDRDGSIEWVNRAFTELTGYTAAEALHQNPRVLKSGNHGDQFYKQMWETVLSGNIWRGELYNRHKDGRLYAEEMTITPVRSPSGEITHFIAVKQDISERKRQEEQLLHLAMHDPVTDLANRRSLEETLERAINRAKKGHRGALLLLDLDNFKQVNDTLGHAAGDQLLVSVALKLRYRVRPFDLLARWGGDEFAVLLEDASAEEAASIGQRLVGAVAEARGEFRDYPHHLGVSIGIVGIDGTLDSQTVMSLADRALYNAKESGGNRVVFLDDHTATGAAEGAERLRHALEAGLFELHFQPVVRLSTGKVESHEALLRLRNATGDLQLPGAFLPAVQRAGLMSDVDLWVVSRVLQKLQTDENLHISVNLADSSATDPVLLDRLVELVEAAGPGGLRLSFEISETAALRDLPGAQRAIWRLKGLGCRFALDDYGTGFSSLHCLGSLPVDCVKLAGPLQRHLDTSPVDRAMVQAVTSVAHSLGREVTAEWVESAAAAEVLRTFGVEYAQGYYFGIPSPSL